MNRSRLLVSLALCLLPAPAPAAEAQDALAGCVNWVRLSRSLVQVSPTHVRSVGAVEIECDEVKFYAEEMDMFTDTNEIVAVGNVVFRTTDAQISAERMRFNTKTRTGVFYEAFGSATLGEVKEKSLFGTQEPDAYFWGEEMHKLGPKKYRLKKGGFTTCVQPTPRWEIDTDDATITLDSHALLRNPVLRVKGVPLFYVPALYYPLTEDDRATGFLIPTYGASTLRGQSLSNAFFWAIGRNQDATFAHDWFTSTGQGVGGEYRYVAAPGSDGVARFYFLDEKALVTERSDGSTTAADARKSYTIKGNVNQALPGRLRLRTNVNYPSNIDVEQRYNYNLYDASNRQRFYRFNLAGAWGPYLMNATADHTEVFYGTTSSTLTGTMPRVSLSRSERPIGRSPVYFTVNGDAAKQLRESRSGTKEVESGLTRLEVMPVVRVPFTRWPFLTLDASLAWRATYWTESLDANRMQVDESLTRQYFDFQTRATGPTVNRIWDTPGSGFAQKWKHVIEPSFMFQRVTPIDTFDQIVKFEGTDFAVGRVTRLGYALTNRLYAKPQEGGATATPREIVNVAISQSYYTDANAAQYDRNYQSSFAGPAPSHFTPVALTARANPTLGTSAQFRTEYDTQFHYFKSFSAVSSASIGAWLQASGGWSQRRYSATSTQRDHTLYAAATLRAPDGRVGGTYTFNYDFSRDYFVQQRLIAYYNAQCCGVAAEYQVYNFLQPDSRTGLPHDRRFNVSFTLAGVGTFSNFFGAFGGNQGR